MYILEIKLKAKVEKEYFPKEWTSKLFHEASNDNDAMAWARERSVALTARDMTFYQHGETSEGTLTSFAFYRLSDDLNKRICPFEKMEDDVYLASGYDRPQGLSGLGGRSYAYFFHAGSDDEAREQARRDEVDNVYRCTPIPFDQK